MTELFESDSSGDNGMTDSESAVETDEECLLETLPELLERKIQDISLDPKISVSDHEDDENPSTQGYGSCDTDEDETDVLCTRAVDKESTLWCRCGNCSVMDTEIECYCCHESTHINELILNAEKIECATQCELFITSICNQKVLEMCSFGMMQKCITVNSEGKVKPEGLRYAAYRIFLNICELRLIGKNRRYALPACVIMKIRSLYPSIDGKYKAFKASEFVSRI